jgi:nicotinate-nucleotide adenylyltransferase
VSAVGILGGSFDPVHRGHLALALGAQRALGLARVDLLPCAAPPHKPERALAAAYHRLEMLLLATEDHPGLGVATIEIARPGVHFTVDTLRALRRGAPDQPPVFLCGSDALAEIESWRDYESLLAEFDFGTIVRARASGSAVEPDWPPSVRRRLAPVPTTTESALGSGGRVVRLDLAAPAVSSSQVRSASASGRIDAVLVPPRVARYIQRHRLYAEEAAR